MDSSASITPSLPRKQLKHVLQALENLQIQGGQSLVDRGMAKDVNVVSTQIHDCYVHLSFRVAADHNLK